MSPTELSPTRAELASRCYRRHALADVLRRVRFRPPSQAFGTVIHAGAAAWWKALAQDSPASLAEPCAKEAVERAFVADAALGDDERHTLDLALTLVEGYAKRADAAAKQGGTGRGLPPGWRFVAVEERRWWEAAPGLVLPFTADRLLTDEAGDLVLVDLKTVSRPSARGRDAWRRSLQLKLYRVGIEALYQRPVRAVVVEGLEKTPPGVLHYVRCPDWSQAELAEAVALWRHYAERDAALRALPPDAQEDFVLTRAAFNYQDCYAYNTACQYLDLCNAPCDIRAGLLHDGYSVLPEEVAG